MLIYEAWTAVKLHHPDAARRLADMAIPRADRLALLLGCFPACQRDVERLLMLEGMAEVERLIARAAANHKKAKGRVMSAESRAKYQRELKQRNARSAEEDAAAIAEGYCGRLDKMWQESARVFTIAAEKAEALDNIIELLGQHKIGDKLLLDCTRGDYLREAARLETAANEMILSASMYRKFAALVGESTIRQMDGRDPARRQIVALLTSRFGDEA